MDAHSKAVGYRAPVISQGLHPQDIRLTKTSMRKRGRTT